MRKVIIILICILIFCSAETVQANGASAVPKDTQIVSDNRATTLRQFLNKYNSQLEESAEEFVAAADFYNLDWRILPAISGIESTFGKQMINGSYNAYGWGGGKIYFKSWSEGIWTISKALKEKYVEKGASDIYKIGRIYCPPNPQWAYKVNSFMEKIEKTSVLTPSL